MNNEDTLMSKLLAETYNESEKESSDNVVDLNRYFEKRLNEVDYISIDDYFRQQQINHCLLSFNKATGCYRLCFEKSVLDFPSNWSIFNALADKDLVFLNEDNDQDFLLDIFAELSGKMQNLVLVKDESKVQVAFLPGEETSDHLGWMHNYFAKKSSDQNFKKEAA